MIDLSVILRGLRLSANYTQQQVASLVGVSKGMISAYETGIRQPSFEVLIKLSDVYKVSTDFLLSHKSQCDYSLDGLTEEQVETVLKIIKEMKKANGLMN